MQAKFADIDNGGATAVSYEATEVINSRQEGYRRAGFVLKKGRNELPPVDDATRLALEADPFLTVTIIGESYQSTTGIDAGYKPTRDELLTGAIMSSSFESDPLTYFNKDGSPRLQTWREIVGDESLTKDDVISALAATE